VKTAPWRAATVEYKKLIRDFAVRTRANLTPIYELAALEDAKEPESRTVFEVTQLINSMLGLLVFPKEAYKGIPPTPISDLEKGGYPRIAVQEVDVSEGIPDEDTYKEHLDWDSNLEARNCMVVRVLSSAKRKCQTLADLIHYMRNAIAHCHIKFFCDDNYEIVGLKVWNIPPTSGGKKNWEATMSVDHLRQFTLRFTEQL
jgi:hypothetical protein